MAIPYGMNNIVINLPPTQISNDCELTVSGYWTGCPHQPKTKVKSLEFYEDVIRRAIVCELVLSDRKPVIGIARCHPKDKYDEEIGYKMALTKAMADMSRETRAIVWKYYFRKIAKA